MHADLMRFLSDKGSVFFEPLSGNHGDRLIKESALAMLRDCRRSLVHQPNAADTIILNGGGGMLSGTPMLKLLYHYMACYRNKNIIILPSSFLLCDADARTLASLAAGHEKGLHIYCREPASFSRLRPLVTDKLQLHLGHDVALYLTRETISAAFRIPESPARGILIVERRDSERSTGIPPHAPCHIPMKGLVPRRIKRLIKRFLAESSSKLTTDFVRSCLSIVHLRHPELRWEPVHYRDISDSMLYTFGQFLRDVNSARVVFTTRLHVAILRNILGKVCYLVPTGGEYQKNEQVFHHSLEHLGHVHLHNWPVTSDACGPCANPNVSQNRILPDQGWRTVGKDFHAGTIPAELDEQRRKSPESGRAALHHLRSQ
jgi:exopolysaccharide biosynthesis predicted pyruvyltransferase EpsI